MRAVRRILLLGSLVAAAAAAAVFSGVLQVRDIRVSGLSDDEAERVQTAAGQWLAERHLLVSRGAVLPLVRRDGLVADIAERFPELTDITVAVSLPHSLQIAAQLRQPAGIWCRTARDDCEFWDRSGAHWGSVVPSIGPLLLLIKDERSDDGWDAGLFQGILAAVDGLPPLGVRAKSVDVPDAEPGGIRIATDRGWDLLMDASGDVADQLGTLGVFLADKASDSAFSPAYVDLRTPGRVYFR